MPEGVIVKNKGFTLVEMMIVIGLIGILSAVAMLYVPGMLDSYKVRGAMRALFSDMQMARLRAIKEGKDFAVEFSGNTYCVKSQGTPSGWTDGCATIEDTIIKTVNLASDYSGITMSTGTLIRDKFYSNGKAGYDGAAAGTVTITKGSRTQSICLTTGTGRIRIVDASTCS